MNEFNFRDLFIFELANNHQGSVEHGLRIIRDIADVSHKHGVRGALKFQFRQLDTFIHPDHVQGSDYKHIPRFLSTRLSNQDFATLAREVKRAGLITISTPFDEESVDLIVGMGIEVVKIGSCSASDWPLIEKAAESGKPVIFSTAGLSLKQIDDLVSFFDHRRVQFAIMHCVAIYPTPSDRLQLDQISLLRRRYPGKAIGFSTHEDPEDTTPIQVAVAKGAEIFERHVGVATTEIKLNAYSSTPQQIDRWLEAHKEAKALCGLSEGRPEPTVDEVASLNSLKRGVYARKALKEGIRIDRADVYFAMPYLEGQLHSGEWKDGIISLTNIGKDEPIDIKNVEVPTDPIRALVYTAIHEVKAMLNEARIATPSDFKLEISHHYGMANFHRFGTVLIDCVNRAYCKKIVVQLPGQCHPYHYHNRKEETFQVLYGILEVELDDRRKTLHPGDTLLIQPGVWHRFWTDTGAVFEEISSTHYDDDSYYEDKAINQMERAKRKTVVEHWGRHQI